MPCINTISCRNETIVDISPREEEPELIECDDCVHQRQEVLAKKRVDKYTVEFEIEFDPASEQFSSGCDELAAFLRMADFLAKFSTDIKKVTLKDYKRK